jgi:asparagine synthase (glutamine-hydrolysing)
MRRHVRAARDRFGEKPLYYGWVGGDLVFASELKAIRAHPRFDNAIDRRALGLFASRTHVPAPRSIYEHVYKLEPGCILATTAEALNARPSEPPRAGARTPGLSIERYWSYRDVVADGLGDPIENEASAIRSRMSRTHSTRSRQGWPRRSAASRLPTCP